MCRALSALGHRVTLFIPRSEAYSTDADARADIARLFGDNLPFEVVFVPRVKVLGRLEVLGSVRGTLHALRRHKLDLIYSRNPWSVLFLSRVGTPYVFEVHEENLHDRSALLGHFLKRRLVRNSKKDSCARVVAISEALRRIWEGYGVPREKLLAAHDGVELAMFDNSLSKTDARRRLSSHYSSLLSADASRPLVVYTGALKPDRGPDLMLAAAHELPELEFCFVGGSAEEIALCRSKAERDGIRNVQFAGKVPHREIPLWLAAADILLMMWTWKVPTIRGCSPMKMFEYMAAKRLIVGPAFPTIEEVLENGRDSILFEPDNQEALVAGLKRAASNLADPSLPEAAFSKVAEHYTWTARCQKILAAVDSGS